MANALRQPLRSPEAGLGRAQRRRIVTLCDVCCDPACRYCPLGCCLCLLIIANVQLVVWRLLVRCGPTHEDFEWGQVIPNRTWSHVQASTDSMWYSLEVEDQNASKAGRWWVVDSLLGFYTHFLYQDLQVPGEPMAIEAWRHSYIWSSDHIEMRMCAGSRDSYFVDVGYYLRNIDIFNYHYKMIVKDGDGRVIATSTKMEGPAWRAVVESPSGVRIAKLQRRRTSSEIFDPEDNDYAYDGWSAQNLRPDLLPNEVLSLLQAIYVVNLSNKLDDKRDGHTVVASR